MLQFRQLESSSLYAGLGVQLIDDYESTPAVGPTPAFDASPIGWVQIELDIDDAGTWRPLDPEVLKVSRTAGGVTWFPWLEHYRDASLKQPRKYRVRVTAEHYTPRYQFDQEGVEVTVFPYDDNTPPGTLPTGPERIVLLPAATYPFAPNVPVLRGNVRDLATLTPQPNAIVTWSQGALRSDTVLTDADGEFTLPLRRAPQDGSQVFIHTERPPLGTGPSADEVVHLPQDLPIFQELKIS